ncbi:MAG: nucleotide exchange factor GrpE [Clostridia bacterium]|nr:nucleotide exchange factor GrpE [Clostridia bacterium]
MTEENKYIIDDVELFDDAAVAAEEAFETSECGDADHAECTAECDKKAKKEPKESKKLKAEVEALKTKLAEAEAKLEATQSEAADKYARLAAEYDNFRRRTQKEKEGIYAEAVASTVMGIVPVIDNLMYAEQFGGGKDNPEQFAEGVKLILSKLPETLEKMNVSVFGKPGDTFDPNLHNAIMHVDDDSLGEGEITDVLQCGYKYGDKVIRYAMVKVAN